MTAVNKFPKPLTMLLLLGGFVHATALSEKAAPSRRKLQAPNPGGKMCALYNNQDDCRHMDFRSLEDFRYHNIGLMRRKKVKDGLLQGARVYLSGPMDFVASRATEKKFGWRNRVSQFLQAKGVTIFDPWFKPDVRGLHEYGRENEKSGDQIKDRWTYAEGKAGAKARAWCARQFWQTLHIDLRMVDTSDFTISYCPTNIYSVGTPHEIILARTQYKPVLFVSPAVEFPTLHELRAHLKNDAKGSALLKRLETEIPIKENPAAIPSLWYLPLVGGDNFFDGFGFSLYRKEFGWKEESAIDRHEKRFPPKRPLLPFLEKLNSELPKRWDDKLNRFVENDDWLLWDFHLKKIRGKHVEAPRKPPKR